MGENIYDVKWNDFVWKCELFGCGDAVTLGRKSGGQPNWFWRIMQYLLIGNKWKKIKK